jgi:hypothetical protein
VTRLFGSTPTATSRTEGVKDEDVIAYYKKGVTNIKLFEKIHEVKLIPSPTSWPTSTS